MEIKWEEKGEREDSADERLDVFRKLIKESARESSMEKIGQEERIATDPEIRRRKER